MAVAPTHPPKPARGISLVACDDRRAEVCAPKGQSSGVTLEFVARRCDPHPGLEWRPTHLTFCPLRTTHEHVVYQLGAKA